MKKMNLNFFWLRGSIVLPLFLLLGFFLMSANSASAQYVSSQEAQVILRQYMETLPQVGMPLTKQQMWSTGDSQQSNSKLNDQAVEMTRWIYADRTLFMIKTSQTDVEGALDKVKNELLGQKVPTTVVAALRTELVNLLTE